MIVAIGGIIMLGLIGYGIVACAVIGWMIVAGMGDSPWPGFFFWAVGVLLCLLWHRVFTTYFDLSIGAA